MNEDSTSLEASQVSYLFIISIDPGFAGRRSVRRFDEMQDIAGITCDAGACRKLTGGNPKRTHDALVTFHYAQLIVRQVENDRNLGCL